MCPDISGLIGLGNGPNWKWRVSIGDLGRFKTLRQLTAYLGPVLSEHSSGSRVRRGGITKSGSGEARRMLVEAAWSYRYPVRVIGSRDLYSNLAGIDHTKLKLGPRVEDKPVKVTVELPDRSIVI